MGQPSVRQHYGWTLAVRLNGTTLSIDGILRNAAEGQSRRRVGNGPIGLSLIKTSLKVSGLSLGMGEQILPTD